ncbi:MAG TPA: hypothetical protein VGQ76_24965 [Thermoanaerobaculia bacterium]|nr:hypothetical protein [Thermoanaerobaculia bacterium]
MLHPGTNLGRYTIKELVGVDGNDAVSAKRELGRARAEGIDQTEQREEAELLAAELGVPSQVLPADPPYPNVLRYLAIFDLATRR